MVFFTLERDLYIDIGSGSSLRKPIIKDVDYDSGLDLDDGSLLFFLTKTLLCKCVREIWIRNSKKR